MLTSKGGKCVTVQTKVQQALATAKGIQANFETFSLQTKDEVAKQEYENAANQLQTVVEGLEVRLKQIEQEEPQIDSEI